MFLKKKENEPFSVEVAKCVGVYVNTQEALGDAYAILIFLKVSFLYLSLVDSLSFCCYALSLLLT